MSGRLLSPPYQHLPFAHADCVTTPTVSLPLPLSRRGSSCTSPDAVSALWPRGDGGEKPRGGEGKAEAGNGAQLREREGCGAKLREGEIGMGEGKGKRGVWGNACREGAEGGMKIMQKINQASPDMSACYIS